MDAEEIDLLTGSLRSVFAGTDAGVATRLRELGWDEVAAADPAAATTLLFTEKGRALSAAALLDDAVLPLLPLPWHRRWHWHGRGCRAVVDAAWRDRDPVAAARA
jgi:hypothetical protein